jgi:hypothetical protein
MTFISLAALSLSTAALQCPLYYFGSDLSFWRHVGSVRIIDVEFYVCYYKKTFFGIAWNQLRSLYVFIHASHHLFGSFLASLRRSLSRILSRSRPSSSEVIGLPALNRAGKLGSWEAGKLETICP